MKFDSYSSNEDGLVQLLVQHSVPVPAKLGGPSNWTFLCTKEDRDLTQDQRQKLSRFGYYKLLLASDHASWVEIE